MAKIVPGRVTHQYDGELVVFHIGMTFNRWWRPDLWIPVGLDMRRMLRELSEDPDSGLLGYELLVNGNGRTSRSTGPRSTSSTPTHPPAR